MEVNLIKKGSMSKNYTPRNGDIIVRPSNEVLIITQKNESCNFEILDFKNNLASYNGQYYSLVELKDFIQGHFNMSKVYRNSVVNIELGDVVKG